VVKDVRVSYSGPYLQRTPPEYRDTYLAAPAGSYQVLCSNREITTKFSIAPTVLPGNMHWGGGRNPYFGGTRVRKGSAMVPLDRALANSYRLSTVSMSLSAAVWPQKCNLIIWGRSQ